MAIQIRPQGEAALYQKAGKAIGKAQKTEREEQLAFQREQTLLEIGEQMFIATKELVLRL